jgi:membrane fusion protein (multidrug efflux system)
MNALSDKPVAQVASASTPARQPPLPGRSRKIAIRTGIAVAVLLAAGVAGHWWFSEGRWVESTDNAYVQGDIAVLGPRIEGDVTAIHVADNQVVHAGDPLISLDPTDSQARLDQARGAAAEAAAAIVTAGRQVEQASASIAQSDAMIAQADAELTRASADAGRSGALVGSGWASRQANDLAVADRSKAAAQLAAMRAQRATATSALAVAQAQVTQAQAHKVTQDAAVRLAERNLEYTVIRAPFDGVAGNRAAQLGQHVNALLQLIAVTPLRGQLYVVANFKETQLRHMQPGQKVLLTPDIDSSAAVEGHVDSLAPATGALYSLLPPENATGNFTKVVQRVPVKVVIDPAVAARATWLRAGLSVTAEVDTRGPLAVRRGILGSIAYALGLG